LLSQAQDKHNYTDFNLFYNYAGLGSGMGSMAPTFKVTGINFLYTYQQNSYYGEPDKNPDTLCIGTLRTSSIYSILNLVKNIQDSSIYETNVGVMSGGIHNIHVEHNTIDITFTLHNAYHPIAKKIVDILNTNIPIEHRRLWLFEMFEGDKEKWLIDVIKSDEND